MYRYKSLSTWVWVFISIICIWVVLNRKVYKRPEGVVIHDINYYYGYLPSLFIQHDLKLNFLEQPGFDSQGHYWHLRAPNGGRVFKMSMGMSYMYAPFFFAAHITANLTGQPADGFSAPYQFFMSISGLCYMLLGLLMIRKILLIYFSEKVTALVLLITGLGTNLYFYGVHEAPMSHAANFFLYAAVLYLTILWHKQATWVQSILLGVCIGIASLIRPTNAIIALVPFLYNAYSIHSVRGKWHWMLTYYYKLVTIGICILLPWIPQVLYWKMVTGEWFYYSYGDEHFFFYHPYVLETLFSFRKGLFIYTPLMALAFWGLFILRKRLPQFTLAIWTFTALNIYIISSWWCWWYGGSFGLRAYIEMFALWTIPLAVVMEKILKSKPVVRVAALSITAFLIILNLYQSMQYWNGALHWDGMNWNVYRAQFLRKGCAPGYDDMVTRPDYEKAMAGEEHYRWN